MDGDLLSIIHKFKGNMDEVVIKYLVYRILQGLHFLHEKCIIHRDIKSDNVLFNIEGDVKLADFGFAVQLTEQTSRKTEACGTPAYMAPEAIMKQSYDTGVDIWSFGILCVEFADGKTPNNDLSGEQAPPRIYERMMTRGAPTF